MACVNKLSTNHLDGEFGTISCIRRDLSNIANSFINIGFRLYEADVNNYYVEKGYGTVYEMALIELDMKRSAVSRYINIYKRFHASKSQGKLMDLAPKYREYNYSQLCEMLPLTDVAIKQLGINSSMPVSEIRRLKKKFLKNCDVATEECSETEEEKADSRSENDFENAEHEPVDVEYVEVKRKAIDEIMTFIEFYNSDGADFSTVLERTILNNTKKEAVKLVLEMITVNDEFYRKYLRKELGE